MLHWKNAKLYLVDAVLVMMIPSGNVTTVHLGGEDEMLSEEEIQVLLEDIRTSYTVGYQNDDLNSEAEKWGQIQILEWILSK